MQLSKYVKRTLKAILFAAVFAVLMFILDSAFEMDEASTEAMLTRYSKTADIDMVFIGNSAGEMVDETLYSTLSGYKAFNMCTPSQGVSVSLKNLKMAASHHKIKEAVLLMTFDTVDSQGYDGIDHLYDRTVDSSSPLSTRFINAIKRDVKRSFEKNTIRTEKSVNIWIPWENETMHGFDNVKKNLVNRFSRLARGQRLGCDIAFDLNTKVYETLPGDWSDEDVSVFENDVEIMDTLGLPEGMVSADKMELLGDMCSFCRDNDIRLMVVVTPHRTDYYDRYEDYRRNMETLSAYIGDFVSKRGFVYYNTEDDPALHKILPDEYFYDWEHVSDPYKDKATEYLYGVISGLEDETELN